MDQTSSAIFSVLKAMLCSGSLILLANACATSVIADSGMPMSSWANASAAARTCATTWGGG